MKRNVKMFIVLNAEFGDRLVVELDAWPKWRRVACSVLSECDAELGGLATPQLSVEYYLYRGGYVATR